MGTYLTIEGIRPESDDMTGGHVLRVDTVNGEKIPTPIEIVIANTEQLPKGIRCILRGYESGGMIGLPDEVATREHLPPSQQEWGFSRWFVVTSIVEPKDLKKK